MSGAAASIDHVGIVGPDLATLAARYTRLGFRLTPLARHDGGRTGNHCVMLDGAYLELVATLPGGLSATLTRFLGRYAGAHILAFGIEDAAATLARLGRAGFSDLRPYRTSRTFDAADPASPEVAVSLITLPDPPEGRVHLIRHLTPAVLWQAGFTEHPNRVTTLAEVTVIVAEPAVTAAWYSRALGRPAEPDPAGGYALALPRGRLRILPPEAAPATPLGLPWIAALTLRTGDHNRALRGWLANQAVAHHVDADSIVVRDGDLLLRFEPAPS
jgi:catechol 2,3-dioxygenase-like lactoylglutathione lyase family enzyme